jgi:hypothetical protein
MHRSKAAVYIALALLLFSSCIEEYDPQIDPDDVQRYVVEGRVTDREGPQSIFISRASSVYNPERIPVQSCVVKIYDGNDNEFIANEFPGGEYRAFIPGERLFPGAAFKLEVTTPDGDLLVSGYDTLRYCPAIDSVYYAIEDFVTDDPETTIPGVQFYIDYNGENSGSGKIKFEVVETWKYETDYPIKWIWDGRVLTTYDTPDYSKSVCWRTTGSGEIYTLSTEQMSMNRFNRYPLHKVLNNSAKLLMGYSILLRQLAISEPAYLYYEKIKANSVGSGGLYETQPQQVQGNIVNVSDPDSRVLGYFMVAGAAEKRIFIKEFEGLEPDIFELCSPVPLSLGYRFLRNLTQPVYLWLDGGAFLLDELCVDCTAWGGTTEKPDFWPE